MNQKITPNEITIKLKPISNYPKKQIKMPSPLITKLFKSNKDELIQMMWDYVPQIFKILKKSENVEQARANLKLHLISLDLNSSTTIYEIRSKNARDRFRRLIDAENENRAGVNTVGLLSDLAKNPEIYKSKVQTGFLMEYIYLFKAMSQAFSSQNKNISSSSSNVSKERFNVLNNYAKEIENTTSLYASGLNSNIIIKRNKNVQKIMDFFKADTNDWNNYMWHLTHIIRDIKTLSKLVSLSAKEVEGLEYAKKYKIPFQITPYYLSLFDSNGRSEMDRALRSIVLPTKYYCKQVHKRGNIEDLDFMGENQTQPIDPETGEKITLITRRYPQIVILKPFDSCPQICVYCQRNWELKSFEYATKHKVTKSRLDRAIDWIKNSPQIKEVLITGGDPLTLTNKRFEYVLAKVSKIKHVDLIRIGTRTIVTMPQRFNDELINILKSYHDPPNRTIDVMTHFSHSSEVTPQASNAVSKLKKVGINVYNQSVYIYEASHRFEQVLLRLNLKSINVDPYYCFNTKGKDETKDFRVPIARKLQERREEARLIPGIKRTDEDVFNVPITGKTHLRATGDLYCIIGILENGERIYKFNPWETDNLDINSYAYNDVSITSYLRRLQSDGHYIGDYKRIFYY